MGEHLLILGQKNLKNTDQKDGMKRLEIWLKKDILLFNKPRLKRLKLTKQRKIIQLFNNLFSSGFTLSEMVDFLKKSSLLEVRYTDDMYASLHRGEDFSMMLSRLGFSDTIVTQLSLADHSGNTQNCLRKIESYLENLSKVHKKLIEVMTYPIILLGFLVLIMLGLKNYLLPQMGEENFAAKLISLFPSIFMIGLVILCLLGVGVYFLSKKLPALTYYQLLSKVPFLGRVVKLYLTAFFAREWGNLLGQGLEMPQVLTLMSEQKSRLFQEMSLDMGKRLCNGMSFHEQVLIYPFLMKELSLMIEYGEMKSKLGVELELYAEELWEAFFKSLNKASQFIQPLVFVLVALIVVMIYAAMLLPMYQNMSAL